jgi:hypothetical protein
MSIVGHGKQCDQFTLIDTPFQLTIEITNQRFRYIIIELCENIDNSVQCMIACCCHPFDFLQQQRQQSSLYSDRHETDVFSHFDLCIGQFHIIKYTKDNIE